MTSVGERVALTAQLVIVSCFFVSSLRADEGPSTEETVVLRQCLQYTWLGPGRINITSPSHEPDWSGGGGGGWRRRARSYTLADFKCLQLPKPRPFPCRNPIIFTDKGEGPPDPRDLHGDEVECEAGGGEACVVSTFYFQDQVVNVTAFCSRVSVDQSSTLSDGCETARSGAYVNTVCACPPSERPCNNFIPSGASLSRSISNYRLLCVCSFALFVLTNFY